MTMVYFQRAARGSDTETVLGADKKCGTKCAELGCDFYRAGCPCQCRNCAKYTDCCEDWQAACAGGSTTCSQVVNEAISYARRQCFSSVNVTDSLTYEWGCGPACVSTSALVDVESPLAKLKFGLMALFEANSSLPIDTSLWGATAHIQTVWTLGGTTSP
jgi:hypothetical protein